jgi:5-methylcytosine-specific restriction protein B
VEALAEAMRVCRDGRFEELWPAAEAELAGIFASPTWGVDGHAVSYSEENASSLWRHELNRPVRSALEAEGVGPAAYREWLGEIHYVHVAAYLEELFGHYQENRGWRVLALSLPAAGVAAVGIASHYQGGMRHNRLGEVSNLLFEHASEALARGGVALPGRKITAGDWDGTGLMASPPGEIAGVKLPAGQQFRLKYLRSTTVKKALSSFISVTPLELASPQLGQELGEVMEQLEKASRALV